MAINQWILNTEVAGQLQLRDLPKCRLKPSLDVSPQLASYFRRLLAEHGEGSPAEVVLPSIMNLSGYFNQSELDVLDALYELSKQGYSYCLSGLDSPIKLQYPTACYGREGYHWQSFRGTVFKPKNRLHQSLEHRFSSHH